MRLRSLTLWSLLITLALWLCFSWPLPKHVATGIPSSGHHAESRPTRFMTAGDHLQLFYHFTLVGDMLRGEIPWFHNVYEFNTGDDAARAQRRSFYLPFSFVFALLEPLAGSAFAWNATGFLSLWLTFLFAWLLARRYSPRDGPAALGALIAVALPFRWVTLMGGSPSGYAMMWAPLLWLGLDIAVRDRRARGGVIAGIAVLGAGVTDAHVFFFGVLSIPFWCLAAFIKIPRFRWGRLAEYGSLIVALAPILVFIGLAFAYTTLRHKAFAGTDIAGGRGIAEVALFSPEWRGLFTTAALGISNHIYIGWAIPAIAGIGALVYASGYRRRRTLGDRLFVALLLAAAVGMIVLALGPRGPFNGQLFDGVRRALPPYAMIRQPAKIFCLMPPLLAVAATLGVRALAVGIRRDRHRWLLIAALALAVVIDCKRLVHTAVCLVAPEQAAYAAVVADAEERGETPRALVLPLWPGNSAWSSLYQYYAEQNRLRMVNGYHPVVPQTYYNNVFLALKSANVGVVADDQLETLAGMGVDYIILHEDAYPEKVSPFPVCFALENLLRHPRLRQLADAEGVWAFRIQPEAGPEPEADRRWPYLFSTRHWDAEHAGTRGALFAEASDCFGDGYISLATNNAVMASRPMSSVYAPDLRFMVRVRGHGELAAQTEIGDRPHGATDLVVATDEWTWAEVPCEPYPGQAQLRCRLEHVGGRVDIDMGILAAGRWRLPGPGESLDLPAPCFFHGGFIDLASDTVVLKKDRIPAAYIFYGPKLPLAPGAYEIELAFSSPAEPGLRLADTTVSDLYLTNPAWTPVVAGERSVQRLTIADNLPISMVLRYAWVDDMTLERVIIRRLNGDER